MKHKHPQVPGNPCFSLILIISPNASKMEYVGILNFLELVNGWMISAIIGIKRMEMTLLAFHCY